MRALTLRSPAEEYDAIARLLRERHVHDGVAWSQCAVIAHDTRQVAALEAELAAREVPTRSSGPGRPLGALAPVRDLLRLIDLAARDDWTFDDVAEALVGTGGRLDPIELRRLRSALRHVELAAGGERSGRELLVSAMSRPLEFDLIDTREARRAAVLARTLGGPPRRARPGRDRARAALDRVGPQRTGAAVVRARPRSRSAGRAGASRPRRGGRPVPGGQALRRALARRRSARVRAQHPRQRGRRRPSRRALGGRVGAHPHARRRARHRVRHRRDRRRPGRGLAEHAAARLAARHLATRGCRHPRRRGCRRRPSTGAGPRCTTSSGSSHARCRGRPPACS